MDKLTIQGRGVWQLRFEGLLAQEYAWEKKEIYSPLVLCTSELITWDSVKPTEAKIPCLFDYFQAFDTEWNKSVFFIWEFASAYWTQRKIMNSTVLIYYTTNQPWTRNNADFESNAFLTLKPAMWRAAFSKKIIIRSDVRAALGKEA